jgi:hypothetical protein
MPFPHLQKLQTVEFEENCERSIGKNMEGSDHSLLNDTVPKNLPGRIKKYYENL